MHPLQAITIYTMLTIHINKSATGLTDYFTQSLSKDDYFFSGTSIPGRWHGTLARELGLPEKVSRKDFSNLAHNKHPKTGNKLTPRNVAQRRTAIEYTFSAPKSVSLVMALSPNGKEILNAHRLAVRAAMRAIEMDMQTQTRINGKKTYVTTGNITYARFDHFTARPTKEDYGELARYTSDPQLHSHCVVFNCTKYKGRLQALEGSTIHKVAGYYEAIYHAHLSRSLVRLGYEVMRTKDRWEIRSPGMTRATLEKFSRRTVEIEKLAKKLGILNPQKKAALGAKTRLNKSRAAKDIDLQEIWRGRLTQRELKAISSAKKTGERSSTMITPEQVLNRALEHHLERRSAVPVKKLLGYALSLGYGRLTIDQVQKALTKRPNILYAKKGHLEYLTTKEMVREEDRMIEFASAGKNALPPINREYKIQRTFLNDQQRAAIHQILLSTDRVSILSGAAGVGKSTLLAEIKEAAVQRGKQIFAFAPSSGASRGVLRQKGFKEADTIAMFLKNRELQNRAAGQIIIIDEASLVGVKTMNKIFDTARKVNARIILSGDAAQHSSPERGDALKILEDKSRVKVARVHKILRQAHKPGFKKTIELLSKGQIRKGFDRLDKMGSVIEIEDVSMRHAQIAKDYILSLEQKRSALVISPTHAEGQMMTEIIRQEMKARGRITGGARPFTIQKNLSFTDAQKKDAAMYELGMAIQFHQNTKGFKAGQRYKVMRKTDDGNIIVQMNGTGQRAILEPDKTHQHYQVFQPKPIELAKGDVIQITNNGRSQEKTRLYNGQRFTVQGFTKNGGVQLSNGKTLNKDFGTFTYGYVQTSHAAQGKDAQDVFVAQSAMSFAATNDKQFYVSASRAKDMIRIYTDDKTALREAVSKSGVRMSAKEIANKHYKRKRIRRLYYINRFKTLIKDDRSKEHPQIRLHPPIKDRK